MRASEHAPLVFDLDHLGLGIRNQRVPKVGDGPELRLERENRLSIRRLPLIRLLEARLQMRLDRNIERLRQRLRKRALVDPRLLLRRRQVVQALDNPRKLLFRHYLVRPIFNLIQPLFVHIQRPEHSLVVLHHIVDEIPPSLEKMHVFSAEVPSVELLDNSGT